MGLVERARRWKGMGRREGMAAVEKDGPGQRDGRGQEDWPGHGGFRWRTFMIPIPGTGDRSPRAFAGLSFSSIPAHYCSGPHRIIRITAIHTH